MLDDNDVTLGHVQKVVRTPEGKIELIVSYSKWFGWFGRPVAVPIEAVDHSGAAARFGRNAAGRLRRGADLDAEGKDQMLADDEIIRVALGRR